MLGYLFDRWLDDEYPWIEDLFACGGCGREFIVVYRSDKYPVCPYCVITDRTSIIEVIEEET